METRIGTEADGNLGELQAFDMAELQVSGSSSAYVYLGEGFDR
jgi:hypothetical protein